MKSVKRKYCEEVELKYITTNEIEHFEFREAFIEDIMQMKGYFYMELDNVKILPENSCNRDIREMRANQLVFQITDGRITSFVEEGYKVFDADGKLTRQQDDIMIQEEAYQDRLNELKECYLYSIEKNQNQYRISIDTEDHTYFLTVEGTEDVEKWDRFLNL